MKREIHPSHTTQMRSRGNRWTLPKGDVNFARVSIGGARASNYDVAVVRSGENPSRTMVNDGERRQTAAMESERQRASEPLMSLRESPDRHGHEAPDRREIVAWLLRAARKHLEMNVGFISEVVDGQRVFRYVDTDTDSRVIEVGGSDPLDESYCGHVLSGRLPELLVDPMSHPVSAQMPVTSELPVGSHVSVPIRFSDGRLFGTFCCFAFDVRSSLSESHLAAIRMVAQLAGEYVEAIEVVEHAQLVRRGVIEEVLADPHGIEMAFQPLRDLESMEIVAVEALARFPGRTFGPDWFFSEAEVHGLAVEAEMKAVHLALVDLDRLPRSVRLSVNVSPQTLHSEVFQDAVAGVPPGQLTVEVTEHAMIVDYTDTNRAIGALKQLGVRVAIDDVGMGFSGLNRILECSPDELKLDREVVKDVDSSEVTQALVETFNDFGARAGFAVVAEGIETERQLQCLRELGVKTGQGFHLGQPGPLETSIS